MRKLAFLPYLHIDLSTAPTLTLHIRQKTRSCVILIFLPTVCHSLLFASPSPGYLPFISGNSASEVISIKLKHLPLALMKHADQDHLWMIAGRKKLTHLLEADGNQEVFDFTPSLFSIKEA